MTVYKKTQKGMSELLAQAPGINLKLFNVLLLVDGLRDSAEIIKLAQEAGLPADGLEILFHGGFIEKKFKGSAALPVSRTEPQAPATVPRQTEPKDELKGFNTLYAYLVEQTKALLGLRGFGFQLRIEKATTIYTLKLLIIPISEAIAKKHGFEVSQEFRLQAERLAVEAITRQ
ncbi:MAG: hypothetical protein JWR60_3741 [Polaromonas sp.]|nr:hypothetical protein [Polaromonas sp.]